MSIEDHKSLELAGLVRSITRNLEELVSKVQLKSNIYLDEIKNLKHEQFKAKEAHQELFEKLERLENDFKDHLDANKLLPRFKEEILKCLEDDEFKIKVQMLLIGTATFTSGYVQEIKNIGATPKEKRFGTYFDHAPDVRKMANENSLIGEKPLFSPPLENKSEEILVAVEKGLQKYLREQEIPPGSLAYNEIYDCRRYIVKELKGLKS